MAPHPPSCDALLVKPGLKEVVKFEESNFQNGKRPKLRTCSSVNYSEEEENKDSFLDQRGYLRSTTFAKNPVEPCWLFPQTVSLPVWAGVSSSLDETDQEKRSICKGKGAMEALEKEERKKAVENDDIQTESFSADAPQLENSSHQFALKEASLGKTEGGSLEKDILLIPFPVQETEPHKENIAPVPKEPNDDEEVELSQSAVDFEDSPSGIENARVKVDSDVQLQTVSRKRHAIRKVKRSLWEINDPEPLSPQKKKKVAHSTQKKKRKKTKKWCARKVLPPHEEDIDKIIKQFTEVDKLLMNPQPTKEPADSDSGINSQCNSGEGAGGEGGTSSGDGSPSGEGGGGENPGGNGGDQEDDDDGKKKKLPWWYLPGGQNAAAEVKKKEMEEDEKMTEESCVKRMEEEASDVTELKFLPSKVDHPEQCHGSLKEEAMDIDTSKEYKMSKFASQDVQHAAYCSRKACPNHKCCSVKEELYHMQSHKKWLTCLRCKSTREIVKEHARLCIRKGCRVPDCDQLKSNNKGAAMNPVPHLVTPLQHYPAVGPVWYRPVPIFTLKQPEFTDGQIIFRNSTHLPERHFSEHVDYHVYRNKKLGGGSNGDIHKITVQIGSCPNLQWVVKETKYPIQQEEIEVYKAMGAHENIVQIFGATFHGSDGKINIFMEECEKSLHDYMDAKQSRLTVDEAMYYWLQVLDAVDYLHNLPVPIIHKDIKAKNILLTMEYARAKLADYDSARRLPDEWTEAGLHPLGTKGFVSPEVRDKKRHGRPADIYSMGCFLLELTVGVPSTDTLMQKINELHQLSPGLGELVYHCTKESPEERPTAHQIKDLLRVSRNCQRT